MSETFDHVLDPKGDMKIILLGPEASFTVEFEEAQEQVAAQLKEATSPAKRKRDGGTDGQEQSRQPPTASQVTFRVSSRHLDLASAKSSRKRSQLWSNYQAEPDAFIHLECSEWSANAFLTVLNIIHNPNRKVPKTVSLEMLAKIAVIFDYS
jgi:hypothetical protein